jgi:hypothetical protein
MSAPLMSDLRHYPMMAVAVCLVLRPLVTAGDSSKLSSNAASPWMDTSNLRG